MSLLQELKRRNVLRVATAYIVTAWLIVQVIETIFPAFGYTDRAIRIAVIVLAIGFVPAVIGAWIFEWTPEGLKRDADTAGQPVKATRGFDRGIIVVLLLAVSYFAIDKFVLTEPGIDQGFYGERSIAVMPFEIRSSDPEQQHFANGVTDEIRYLLGTIRDLRVIAEYSSNLLGRGEMGMAVMWDELAIGHLLEGSVRQDGNRVRVSARLVETRTGTQLWTDVYEREIEDVFRIQDDIAKNVLHNLEIELVEPLRNSRNVNPEARALVEQVSEIFQVREPNSGARSYPLVKRALELDPDYAEAVRWMTYSEWMRAAEGLVSWEEANAKLAVLEDRYAELAPDSGYLDTTKGFDAEREYDLEDAAMWYLSALDKELTDSEQLRLAGRFALKLGKIDVGVRILELAVAIDPLCHQCRRILTQAYMYRGNAGDYQRATEVREQFMSEATGGQPYYSMLLILTGEPEKVAGVWADIPGEDHHQKLTYLAMAEHSMGMAGKATQYLARLESLLEEGTRAGMSPRDEQDIRYSIATAAAWSGDADKAFAQLLYAPEQADYTAHLEVHDPVWREIRDDPRWLEYREAIGMSQERLDAIEFDPWLPE